MIHCGQISGLIVVSVRIDTTLHDCGLIAIHGRRFNCGIYLGPIKSRIHRFLDFFHLENLLFQMWNRRSFTGSVPISSATTCSEPDAGKCARLRHENPRVMHR